ncbi:unnamed protein product [Phaeothamnion confervicola]
MNHPLNEPWHLDKQIPLALISAILIQTGAAFWWASSISERVVMLETWRNETKGLVADLAVVKSQIADIKSMLGRIEMRLPIK